jgi:hypothetical protein
MFGRIRLGSSVGFLKTFSLLVCVWLGGEPGRTLAEKTVSFDLDVQPILTARGCNSGPCHGKARGQNGFQLSLLGFDADFDHRALAVEARGRRVFPADPARSLLLRKATGNLPHGGGIRLEEDGPDYETLLRWIETGMPRHLPGEPTLQRIEVNPAAQVLAAGGAGRLQVTAFYSDGTSRKVTKHTQFQSSESPIVSIKPGGDFHAGPLPGEAALMARYMNHIAVCDVSIPLAGQVSESVYDELPVRNFIDELVWHKLRRLRITPSPPVDDARFLRRAHLDIIGRLPTPNEVRTFLQDEHPQKREVLIDRLLARSEYADFWANKWMDLLRPNPYRVGIKAVLNYDHWIRDAFRRNVAYDEFVRGLITAEGSTWRNGAATLFRDRRSPDEITTLVSQLFLGIRLECAKCHHHPFEKWSQHDFYSLAAYFAKVGRKGTGLSPPISGGEEIVFAGSKGEVRHPLTQEALTAKPLFGEAPVDEATRDPRKVLADWITSRDNEFFAKTITNRIWADIMGVGLVEPVDDLRATNPPSNEPLLAALAAHLQEHNFDLKELIRAICTSHVYGLSSLPTERNVADTRAYSRHYRQRLRAEVLLDAIDDITGVPTPLSAMPAGSRAIQLWTHRVDSVLLDTFGRPDANQDPPCERTVESTVTQALHLMNSPQLHRKVTSDEGRAVQLAGSDLTTDQLVEELYLLTYNRFPKEAERAQCSQWFARDGVTRRRASEDLMWALLNSPEFLFKD